MTIPPIQSSDLSAKLNNITDGKPENIEVEVRALYSEINSLEDTYDKKKLLTKLTAVAIRGLRKDLQNLLSRRSEQLGWKSYREKPLSN